MRKLILLLLAAFVVATADSPAFCAEERPVNFIFLIDVSGSMVLKSTMVTAADGTQITLFEALREALKQVAEDPRLINSKSRISFITFGTKIDEKTDWPTKLESAADRQTLLQVIQSPQSLSADKHGDTYMGGALSLALNKANQMYAQTEPCTTTFIVMLTDGWDEPPPGAPVKVRTVAGALTQRQNEIFKQVGIKTWKVLVIGLQRLPDRKAGTTTAKELAELLGGGFIDVSKQAGGTVSERIFFALKSQVEQLRGELSLGVGNNLKNGVVDFSKVSGSGAAQAVLPLQLRSCYSEEITGLKDVTGSLPAGRLKTVLNAASAVAGGVCQSVASLPKDAIVLTIAPTQVAAGAEGKGNKSLSAQELVIKAQANSDCPAGNYAGCFKLESSARVPDPIGWVVKVPGRLISSPESLRVKIRKPGFFFPENTTAILAGKIKELPGAHVQAHYDFTLTPSRASLTSTRKNEPAESLAIEESAINGGKPLTFALDTSSVDSHEFKIDVAIKGSQVPGKYAGVIAVKVSGPPETAAPSEIPFEITVEPSAWEEIAPLAIPIFFVLILVTIFGLFLWFSNVRRD